jgi:molecular chaperone DnaK (HSP70)
MTTIGIDLGTYNSAAAYAQPDGQVMMIESSYGRTWQGAVFPSFVRLDALGNVQMLGEEARQQMAVAPQQVVWGVKRLIGRSFREVEAERRRFLYPLDEAPDGGIAIPVGAQRYSPEHISRLILAWIKREAESPANPFVGDRVDKAIITHPAYFKSEMVRLTREAARGAGFAEIELIAEPVAATLAYGLRLDSMRPQFVMAIDWGAGTLDIVITMLQSVNGRPVVDQARPASGHVQLGGIDMDDALLAQAIAVYRLDELKPLVERLRQGQPLAGVDATLLRNLGELRLRVEQAKIRLSEVPTATVDTPYRGRPLTIQMARSRQDAEGRGGDWVILEDALAPHLERLRSHMRFALQENGLAPEEIDHVLMIGGPMHMPCVRRVIGEVFARNGGVCRELAQIEAQGFPVNPMECVAQGAALYGQEVVEAPPNQLPYHYGLALRTQMGIYQGKVLLERGRMVPCEGKLEGLTAHGQPGDAIPVSIYTWEVGPDGGYQLIGDFRFSPAFDTKGVARFTGVLRADQHGVVSALWSDMRVAGAPLRLEGLNELRGEPMPEPLEIQEVDLAALMSQMQSQGLNEQQIRDQLQQMTEEGQLGEIPAARVEATRRASENLLNLAESSMRRDPRLAADAQLLEAVARLQRALQRLPRGASPYPAWAAAAHGAEELFLPLERAGVLSKESIRTLRGELGGGAK